jgi:hypothetical protein
MNKPLKVLFIILMGFLFIIIIYIKKTNDISVKKMLLDEEIYAKVLQIYHNRDEHNFKYVKFSNGENKIMDYPYKEGDSVSKKRGDSIEYIYRGNVILKQNLFETARKNKALD